MKKFDLFKGKVFSKAEKQVLDVIYDNDKLFEDMRFESEAEVFDSVASKFGLDCSIDMLTRPDELEYFQYNFFDFEVRKLGNETLGIFIPKEQKMVIDPSCIDREDVILHELIHLHEFVLNSLPPQYSQLLLLTLYFDLKYKVEDLDDYLVEHMGLLNSFEIIRSNSAHSLLFLLKSFDLDIRKGYPVGTILNYELFEQENEYPEQDYEYPEQDCEYPDTEWE